MSPSGFWATIPAAGRTSRTLAKLGSIKLTPISTSGCRGSASRSRARSTSSPWLGRVRAVELAAAAGAEAGAGTCSQWRSALSLPPVHPPAKAGPSARQPASPQYLGAHNWSKPYALPYKPGPCCERGWPEAIDHVIELREQLWAGQLRKVNMIEGLRLDALFCWLASASLESSPGICWILSCRPFRGGSCLGKDINKCNQSAPNISERHQPPIHMARSRSRSREDRRRSVEPRGAPEFCCGQKGKA